MSKRLVSQEQIQAAFELWAEIPDLMAAAKGMVIRREFAMKKTYAQLYLKADGAVETRKMWATAHPEYEAANEAYIEAQEQLTNLQERVKQLTAVSEAWRTQEASERKLVGSMR